MTIEPDDHFYNDLPVVSLPLAELVAAGPLSAVPPSWYVVITDIKGSTKAVRQGKHELVNQAATGSIVTVLNIAFKSGLNIPFFFGGDGATFVISASLIGPVTESLLGFRDRTYQRSGLYLRVGAVPVSDIYAAGEELRVAKFSVSASFVIPVILGHGLVFAEKRIKESDEGLVYEGARRKEPDLNGMQCRWDRIPPPASKAEIVTLLIAVAEVERQSELFSAILKKIEVLYGPLQNRQPISVTELRFKSTFRQLKISFREVTWTTLLETWLNTCYFRLFFKTQKGRNYLQKLVEMSDTLVLDGRINTVMSGTASQRQELLQFLDELEDAGHINYGTHISSASVMSCYVRDMDYGHIHFVDGSDGGYTHAAAIIKRKIEH